MPTLTLFSLPLPPTGPPSGFGWGSRPLSQLSTTTAFGSGIDARDTFLGRRRCVVCGVEQPAVLEHCHISMRSEVDRWAELRRRYWIPNEAKRDPTHESRNGLLMCSNHHKSFDGYVFFIRFFPDFQKYVFINYSDSPDDRQYHGKAIALQPSHRYAPLPSLFIIHEIRVRGFNPFQPIDPPLPHDLVWQDWILSDGVFGNTDTVSSDRPSGNQSAQPLQQVQLMPTVSGHTGGRRLALNADIISEILAATRAMPSWKACQVEGTSWTGTAEENIQKYVSDIGVQDSEV